MGKASAFLTRLKNQGDLKGVIRKIAYKKHESAALKKHGSASFPSREERKRQEEYVFRNTPTFSILVPVWNNDPVYQKEMMDSVMSQTYPHWELCMADGSDRGHSLASLCRDYEYKSDGRIHYVKLEKNLGIAENTNECLKLAFGDYICLLDQDDILHPSALFEYARAINEEGADYLYSDEATFQGKTIDHLKTSHFKPDFAPDNLLANNYICHFSCFKASLLEGEEVFRKSFDGAQDHDMILRMTGKAKKVVHIPKVLYYWRNHQGSSARGIDQKPYVVNSAMRAIHDRLRTSGFNSVYVESTRASGLIFQLSYEIKEKKKVSILLWPDKNRRSLREKLSEIIENTDYPDYEILLPYDTGEFSEGLYLESFSEEMKSRIRLLAAGPQDNECDILNRAAGQADGDYLLFLDRAVKIDRRDWINELFMHAMRKTIGCVSCKLVSRERTIEHAGIILGQGTDHVAGYSHYGMRVENVGYMGRLCYAQDVSAVTGACMMVRRDLFLQVGGFDEAFGQELAAVDLCLKIRQKGYYNLFTPFVELVVERPLSDQTSGGVETEGREALFRRKWSQTLIQTDPFYNRNFRLDTSDFSLK